MSHRITVAEELRTDADLIAIRAAASHVVSVVDPVTSTLTGTLTAGHLTAVDCTAGPATYTLPSAASAGKGGVVVVKKNDTTSNTIAVQRSGSDVIQGTGAGSTSRSVTLAGEAVTLVSNGTNSWSVTSSDVPIGQLDSRYNGTYVQRGLYLDLRDYVQSGDGSNYRPALSRALAAASSAGGAVIQIPPGSYGVTLTSSTLSIPANTSLIGVPGKTLLNVDTDTPGAYREVFRNGGDNVAIEGLAFMRVSDFSMVMFPVQAFSGYRFTRCNLLGNRNTYTSNFCHGWQIGVQNAGVSDGLVIDRCTVTKMSYGLFQASASTATCMNIQVTGCAFSNNYSDDLEFNSPNATTTGVRVRDCRFDSNQQTAASSGFAVGLAHVVDVVVADNSITSYANEGIHVEDYCTDVLITGNTLTSCGTLQGAYIQVISGCSRVRITNNSINAIANGNAITAVNVLAGGTGTTPGGRTVIAPTRVIASSNNIECGANARGIYFESMLRGVISGNVLQGSGTVNSGSYGGGINWAIQVWDGRAVAVSGNSIRGFLYGFAPITNGGVSAFGDGYSVTGNAVYDCQLGIAMLDAGGGVFTGNTFGNCQYPAILSYSGSVAHTPVFVGNAAWGCANPMGIYGTVAVTATGSVTTGTGKTLTVSAIPNQIPSGAVITFSGGGTLTLTARASFQATSLSGTVAGANVGVGETATVYLPASSDSTRGRVVAFNLDEAAANGAAAMGPQGIRKSVSTNYTLTGSEALVITTAAVTVTLPHAGRYYGSPIRVKNTAASATTVASASGTVEGGATASLAAGASAAYVSDGTNWLQV